MSRPYVVGTPPYEPLSGGCRVIHKLVHELNVRGQTAFAGGTATNPEWDTPYFGVNKKYNIPYDIWKSSEDAIAVYPEITFGNPFETRTVVRYLLNNAGKLSGPKHFDSSDILFAFSHMFNEFNLPEERIMFMPVIDTAIFNDPGYERNSIVFYVGKGWRQGNESFVQDSVRTLGSPLPIYEISKETARDQAHLASILQRAEVFYTYDNITAMTEIARLCGARTVIIPNGEYTKEQYSQHELGWYGLGWGEIPAPFDSQVFKQKYDNLREVFYQKLDGFIEVTQNA